MGGTYQVAIEHFSGPFDLLLHLVARRRIEIADVPLSQIVDDYLTALGRMERLDLEAASEFLVVAATLMELKAARLLPGPDPETDEFDLSARDLLYARLLDYRAFRGAAEQLAGRWDDHVGFVARDVGPEWGEVPRQAVEVPLSLLELAELAHQVLTRAAEEDAGVALPPDPASLTLAEAAELLLAGLEASGGRVDFERLTDSFDVADVVVAFLAALELYKREQVDLHQKAVYAPLVLARATVPAVTTGPTPTTGSGGAP